jgi:hypothetical protein
MIAVGIAVRRALPYPPRGDMTRPGAGSEGIHIPSKREVRHLHHDGVSELCVLGFSQNVFLSCQVPLYTVPSFVRISLSWVERSSGSVELLPQERWRVKPSFRAWGPHSAV